MGEDNKKVVEALAGAMSAITQKDTQNEGTTDQNGGVTTSGENTTTPNVERTFTQEEVSKMMAREKQQGKNSVYNSLGIDPEDTSAIQMFKAFVESQKTQEEQQAEQQQKQLEKMQAMQKDLEIAQAKATLMQAGISPDYVDDAVTIAMARVAVDKDLDIEGVAKDLKSKYSVWFEGSSKDEGTTSGASSSEKKTTGQKGTGRNPGTSDSSNSSNNNGISGIGKRLAIAKKSSMPEKSFWND